MSTTGNTSLTLGNGSIGDGEGGSTPCIASAKGLEVIVVSADSELALEGTKFIGSMEQMHMLESSGYERIIFVAHNTRFAFELSDILRALTGDPASSPMNTAQPLCAAA